jgi:hypothetical protein
MANEFKIRKGLIVEGASGGVVVNVLGSQGQLLSVTDDLSGSIFAVSDISGVPIFDVNSSGNSYFDGEVSLKSRLNLQRSSAGATTLIQFKNEIGADRAHIDFGGTNEELSFFAGDGTTENMTINSAGNAIFNGKVGIGLITPTGNLSMNSQIDNGTYPPGAYTTNTAATRYQSFFNSYYNYATDGLGPYPRFFDMVATGSPDGTNGGSNIRFLTTGIVAATGAVERMRITSAGNSLFNYTNPTIQSYGSGAYGGKVVIKASGAEGLALLNNAIGGSSQVAINFTNEFVANQYNWLARIIAEPEQSWSGTASTRSSRLTFSTNNAGTIGEKMRITSAGGISFGSTGTAYGTSGQVLTSAGNASPTWQDNGSGDISGTGTPAYVAAFTGNKTIASGPIVFSSNSFELLQSGTFMNSNHALYNGTSSGGTGTTAVQYIKIFDKDGNGGQQYLHFSLLSFSNSEYSAEVKIIIPAYSGFSSSYGTMDAGQGVQVEIVYGGLSGQTSSILSIIECADLSSTSTNTDLYLKIQPVANTTQVMVRDYGDCTTRVLTNQTWSTTAPSNQHREFTFNVGATNINQVLSIHRDQKVGIGVDDPQAKLEVKGVSATPADGNEVISVTNTTGGSKLLLGVAENSYGWIQSAEGSTYRDLLLNPLGGEVGIGVTGPGEKLEIDGNIRIHNSSNAPYIDFTESGAVTDSKARITMDQIDTDNGTLLFATENAGTLFNQVKITQTGNLLLSDDAANFNTSNAKLNVLPASSGVYQQWNYSPNNETFALKLSETVTSGNVRYVFDQNNNGSTYSDVLVFNQGEIGIGTDEPSEKLHVVGNVFLNANSAFKASYNNTDNYHGSMRWAGLQLGNNGTNKIVAGRTNTGGGFQFWTNNTNDAADYTVTPDGIMTMAMTETGNVGIGYTAPDVKLVLEETPATIESGNAVNGSSMKGIKIRTNLNGDESVGLWFGTNGSHWSGISGQRKNAASTWGTTLSFYTHENYARDLTYARERMIIDSEGNVGIGTSTPLAKLDIQGTQGQLFSVTDNLSGSIFAVSDISGVPIFDVNSSGVSYFDDKVAIGTLTGASANGQASQLWLRSTENNGMTISSGNSKTGTIFFGDVANAAAGGFRYNHNTGDMAISAEDNITFACDKVGIGVTGPTEKLEVNGTIASIASSVPTFKVQGSDVNYQGRMRWDTNNNVLEFLTRHAGTYYSDTLILKEGKVGIGINNPSTTLSVQGTSSNGINVIGVGTTATRCYLGLNSANKGYLFITGSSGENPAVITSQGDSYISTNLGIGNTSPDKLLHVGDGAASLGSPQGAEIEGYNNTLDVKTNEANNISDFTAALNLFCDGVTGSSGTGTGIYFRAKTGGGGGGEYTKGRIQGAVYTSWTTNTDATRTSKLVIQTTNSGTHADRVTILGTGATTFVSTVTATNFILSSDKTLKENIKDISNEHIDVSWKSFELKSEPGVKRSGVIAQELETKHPEFVRTNEDGLKSVAYIDLLIAKIAELEARLEKAGL